MPAPSAPRDGVDRDAFVVHADDDAPFVHGELLPMLSLAADRVILSSALPFPAFTEQAIERAVRRSRLTIAVVSPAYLRDRWASFAELLSRNVDDDAGGGGTLVPLVIADCEVPAILAQHAALDGRTQPQRARAAARLRERLGRPEPLAAPIECPYPGMRPFSAATAARFHGRENEIDEVLGRLRAGDRQIYVIGPSGSGKSSLIAAGVLPRVQAGFAEGSRFVVRAMRPGEHPAQNLADALACDPTRLDGAIGRLLAQERGDGVLIFVDQLEELFTLAEPQAREPFVRALRVLRADRRCHLIVALRADFYGALMSSELWPDIDGRFTRLEVAPLRGPALRAAIELPAFDAGVYLERGLVERLMHDAAAEPGALPLLQEALVLLWVRRSHRLLRLESYEALDGDAGGPDLEVGAGRRMRALGPRGGLAVALARRADAALHDLAPAQQRVAQRIFLRLVSFGEGRPDTRRQQARAALAACGTEGAGADPVIDHLIEARLLTSDATSRGEPLIDLAHEALIAGWPALQHWLLSRRDDEQRRRLLELHAAQWVQRGCGSVGLFDAIELAEAERWIAGETALELGYSTDLPRFMAASRNAIVEAEHRQHLAAELQERERRAAQDERVRLRRRLARFSIGALALVALVASSIGFVAWRQREEAEVQRQEAETQRREAETQRREAQRQLARNEFEQARSLVVDQRDSPAAIPHLAEAAKLGFDSAMLGTVFATAARSLWQLRVRREGPVVSAAFSPDGTRVVTASKDGTARVWDAASGTPLGLPLKHDEAVTSAAFSPDGTRVVTASKDGTARIWDTATGNPLGLPLRHDNTVTSAAFSPDGTRVVTASEDGTARVWRITEPTALGTRLQQAMSCLVQQDATASSRVCSVAEEPMTAADLDARAQALTATGDITMHTHVWSIPRARYLQALSLLDPFASAVQQRDQTLELRRAISVRLAVLAALEDGLVEARIRLGSEASDTDAGLLNKLGGFAHDGLHDEVVAVALLRRAHDLDPRDTDILASLAEVYFAAGQTQRFARAASEIDARRTSLDVRVALAALAWANSQLTRRPAAADSARLLHLVRDLAPEKRLAWSWNGTKHALLYGRYRHEDAKPIVEVLTLLEQEVTDHTRAQLAALLAVPE